MSSIVQPDPDGKSYRVRCSRCGEVVPANQAHVISTSSGFGRAYRCDPCGVDWNRQNTKRTVSSCQDCHHGRDRHDPNVPGCIECRCTEFLPSQALELWEMAQQMKADPEFDPGWPFGDLIRERGWDA